MARRRVNTQQRQIAFSVDSDNALHLIDAAVVGMNFGAVRIVDDVAIGDDAIGINEETAAAREFFTARIEGFDRDRGRFDAANELGQQVLRGAICHHRNRCREDQNEDE